MTTITGRIDHWDRQKGYGYVVSDQGRTFLHIRDFAERHKAPEVGDVIVFSLGTDQKGRTCAKQAVHHNDGGRLRLENIVVLAVLLIAPAMAAWRLLERLEFRFFVGIYIAASVVVYVFYAYDKWCARSARRRVPESLLHFFELFGGWPGAFIAQRRLRHKCTKRPYRFIFWLIVLTHEFIAIDAMLQWRGMHALRLAIAETVARLR